MGFKNRNYWNKFYKKKLTHKQTPFAEFIQKKKLFEKFIIYDLGCGNGRDTVYLNKNNLRCYGIDKSAIVIKQNKKKNPKLMKNFLYGNFCNFFNKKNLKNKFVIYSRFTWHTIGYKDEEKLLRSLKKQRKLKYILIETRTTKDELYGLGKKVGLHEYVTSHYRRFIDPVDIREKLKKFSKIIFFEQKKGLAKFKKENPCVLRIIAKVR